MDLGALSSTPGTGTRPQSGYNRSTHCLGNSKDLNPRLGRQSLARPCGMETRTIPFAEAIVADRMVRIGSAVARELVGAGCHSTARTD